MLKPFQCVWKNATHNKSQVIVRRFSLSVVQVHFKQFDPLNRSTALFATPNHLCDNRYKTRYFGSTANKSNLIQSQNILSKYKAMEANLKWRTDPVITTLDTPQFKTILRKNILDLVAIFQKYDYEIRIAGGAVR